MYASYSWSNGGIKFADIFLGNLGVRKAKKLKIV